MRKIISLFLVALGISGAAACSDDTYVATNETLETGGSTSSGGSTSTGGASGAAGSVATGGDAGMAGLAGAAGEAGAAGGGGATGVCTPGEKQDVGTCQKCGTSRRTCDANGAWGTPVCEDQKDCNPGDKTTTGCTDPCAEKVCSNSCTFGSCGLKSGAKCLYESGTNFQCCGADHWQFCNKDTCDWYACQACSAGSSCLTAC
jgi:hypothetical protein